MVCGPFCQCQRSSPEPTISVRSGNVNVARRDDEYGEVRDVRKRIDFVAAADAQRAASKQEKRHIGAQRGSHFEKARQRQLASSQTQIAEQRGCRVTRTASQSAAGRNGLLQFDGDPSANLALATEGVYGAVDEIFLYRLLGEHGIARDL